MAFGLTGAPGSFQGAMNATLAPGLRKFVIVFFDDILVYSCTFEEHLDHLRQVFEWLANDQWKLKLSKCKFAQRSIAYLGHIISEQGVSTDATKVQAVVDWPTPSCVKELRSFLGLAGYYRKFVKHFGIIARPLTNLLKKNTMFIWTSDHDSAFTALKSALSTAPVLSLPDFSLPFAIETDACLNGVGAVLTQQGHPLAFISKALGPRNMGLSTYEKEYLAILVAVDQWRHYLQYGEFIIYTDQKSLIHLNEQRLHTPWQQKVFTKLLGLQYRIVYKQGSTNRVADALSRRPSSESVAALSTCRPQWLDALVSSYAQDPMAADLITKLSLHPDSVPHYSLSSGVLRYKNRVWLGCDSSLHSQVIATMHSSALGGHSGFPVTYSRLKQYFAWPNMKKSVREFVRACQVCQQAKPDRNRYPGLLQPLPVPTSAWEMVSLDFVEGLPRSGQFNSILVVVDKYSKFAHFIPLRHPFSALSVAKVYTDHVYKLHGMPTSLILDHDRIFTSNLWRELFGLAGVQLRMSSAYHPQTDGQTERVNQCMETYLRCFVHACPTKWSSWLSLAEFWYNTSSHSALGRSPFEVLYGHAPRHFGLDSASACAAPDLSSWLHEREVMQSLIQQHLLRAQDRMKRQADKRRSERVFQVGDRVSQDAATCAVVPCSQGLSKVGFQILRSIQHPGAYRFGGLQARIAAIYVNSPCFSCVAAQTGHR